MVVTGLIIGIALISFVLVSDLWLTRSSTAGGSRARKAIYIVFGGISALAGALGAASAVWNLTQEGRPGVLPVVLVGVGLAGAVTLLPAARRALAWLIPFDPESLRTTIGLTVILWFAAFRIGEFVIGEPVEATGISYASLVVQALTLVGVALVLVGVPHRRTLGAAVRRLGLEGLSQRQVTYAVLLVFGIFALAVLATSILNALAPEVIEQLEETSDQMTADLGTFWGALAIGLGAALGEELLFRGAIQPKYGIVFTALVFAVLHVQYHPALIFTSVLPAGIILGLERKHMNTSACIITHMLYNTTAVLLSSG